MPNKKEIVDVVNFNLKEAFISDVNNYKYTSQASLVAWFDLKATPEDQTDNSSSISSISYRSNGLDNNGDAVLSNEAFNVSSPSYPTYNVARFNKANIPDVSFGNKRNLKVVYSSGPTPITFGGGSGDSPFSVSIWAKVHPSIGSNAPGWMFSFGQSGGADYYVQWESSGFLNFVIRKNSSGAFKQTRIQLSDYATTYSSWHHYAFTYDGNESSPVLRIYINGELQSTADGSAGSYDGMTTTGTELQIGSKFNETDNFTGFLSQMSIFSTELNQENIRAIYEGTSIGSYQDKTTFFSGELSNPPKDVVRTLDARIKNIHDGSTKKSTQKRRFNDMDTIDFVERELIASIGVEQGKSSTPFIALNTFDSFGIPLTATYDNTFTSRQTRNTFEGDSEAFNESEKFYLKEDFFKDKEISFDILDQSGLSRNVNQKDIIEIDLRPVEPTTFGIESGVGSSAKNDLMVYWNNTEKKWDKIGGTRLKPPSIAAELEAGVLGFAPTSGFVIPKSSGSFDAAFKNYGMHIDNFGFPKHPKYEATDEQYINASDFISEPFVVEKMVYEFDAVLHVDKQVSSGYFESDTTTNFTQLGHLFSAYTFFMLRERQGYQYEGSFKSTISDGDNLSTGLASIADTESNKKSIRELIGYMQTVVFSDADNADDVNYGKFRGKNDTNKLGLHPGFLRSGLSRELNIPGSDFIDSSSSIDDTKFAFSGSAIMSGTIFENGSHESFGLTFNIGGNRNSITNLGSFRSEDIEEKIYPRGYGNGLKINQKNLNVSFNHSLFLGASVNYVPGTTVKKTFYTNLRKPNPYIIKPGDKLIFGWQTPVPVNCFDLNDSNGSSKMTINTKSGKLKLYGSFLSNNFNKKGTDIFYENSHITRPIGKPLVDTYQIEPRKHLREAYFSKDFSGKIPNRESSDKENTKSTVKSSIHFSNLTDANELIYDSYLPDYKNYLLRRGITSLQKGIITSNDDLSIFKNHRHDAPVYIQDGKRQKSSKIAFSGFTAEESREIALGKGFDTKGASDGFRGSKSVSYGMYNYNLSSNKMQVNTRHFGHHSDIIEQRRSYAFESKGSVIYPVNVKFFRDGKNIEPIESKAQNINPHAESYFPFYDGEILTFRTDDTSKIENISIDSIMLDEKIAQDQIHKEFKDTRNINLK